MNDTPRADTNGVVATIHRDGYWTNKMPEQDPFPYLSQHGPIEVCLASELAVALEENAKLAARMGELEKDAERYRWLRGRAEFIPHETSWEEVVRVNKKGQRIVEDRKETFWQFSIKDDWELGMRQDERPTLDAAIDAARSKP